MVFREAIVERPTRKSRRPPRLRGALTMLFLLVPTFAIALVATFAVVSYRKAQGDALVEEARTILSLLVRHHPAIAGEREDATRRRVVWGTRITELPTRQPRIKYAILFEASGNDLTAGIPPIAPTPLQPGEARVEPGLYSLLGDLPIAHVSERLPDLPGAWIQIGLVAGPGWAHFAHLHDIGAILLVTLCLNIWMIRIGLRRLIAPLENVAHESRSLAAGREARPVVVEGPQEVRHVAIAFNSMLQRRNGDAARIENTLKQLRHEQAASEFERRRFTAMVEALHEGLVYLSPDGRVEYMNPEAERLLGRSAGNMARAEAPTKETVDKCSEPERVVASLIGEEAWREVRGRYHLQLALVAVQSGERELPGSMLLLRDRTEERRLQRLMAEQEKIVSVGTLAAGIAHEINNPLDGLQNCLRRIIRNPTNTDQIERYAGLMTASLHHIETVVRQLLDLSHKRDRVVRKIDVNEVIRGAVELARTGQRWSGVQVEWRLGDNLPPVLADPQNLTQVFLNLVLNAVDAMPDGGTLVVTSRAEKRGDPASDDEDVLVEMSDTGCGIEPRVLPCIFDPFFTTKSESKGTGLGLSVSRNLIVEHGGDIQVKSEYGLGTTFTVRLPRFFPARTSVGLGTEISP